MPSTPVTVVAHLVAEHDWSPEAALEHPDVLRLAHFNAHGLNGHPELADPGRRHDHTAPSAEQEGRAWGAMALLGALVVIGGALALAIREPATASRAGASTTASGARTVTYKVTGSASGADLTMATGNGGTSQQGGVDVPLRSGSGGDGLSFTARRGTFLYIAAQNTGERGTITCAIEVDGVPLVSNTSSGAYTIASCSGTL